MRDEKERPERCSPRWRGHDYASPGFYFVTAVTWRRRALFGSVVDGRVQLSTSGEITRACWLAIPRHHPSVRLDAFVVMPDHVHGVLILTPETAPPHRPPTLSAVVRGFKAGTVKAHRQRGWAPDLRIWQRGFHDRVVRDDDELDFVRGYIAGNPARWRDRDRPR